MFSWIIEKVNSAIAGDIGKGSAAMARLKQKKLKFIGLLDIFGFEIFEENSFE